MEEYGYAKDHSISKTIDILKRIPQEDIYEFILGYRPVPNVYTRSPIRIDDTSAGAWFEWVNSILYFRDFADTERVTRDCFQMLMDLQGVDLKTSIRMIADRFNAYDLPIIYPEFIQGQKFKGNYVQGERSGLEEIKETEITFKARTFSDRDRLFWNVRYGESKANLIEDGVFPIIWYRF